MTGVERILDRALQVAKAGQRNPYVALIEAEKSEAGDTGSDHVKAFLAVVDVCGAATLSQWCEAKHSPRATVSLFEEALFKVQMGG